MGTVTRSKARTARAEPRPILLVEDSEKDEVLTLRALRKNRIHNEVVHGGRPRARPLLADPQRAPAPRSRALTGWARGYGAVSGRP
jgi:hypothetical protein